jgi:hypothetical protein
LGTLTVAVVVVAPVALIVGQRVGLPSARLSAAVTPAIQTDYSSGADMAADPNGGYWVTNAAGAVVSHGGAPTIGSLNVQSLQKPIVGMAATPDGGGYWLVASDGGVFSFGNANFYGSTGSIRLNKPIVGMAPTPDGAGYWLVASDGGVFSFGNAAFYGSTGSIRLNQPIVGMAATLDGRGYRLVASDGGVFSFGDARFYGSTGSIRLNKPILALAGSPDGGGYWLVASDGGVFSFGDASFYGSDGGSGKSIVGMIVLPSTPGYALVDSSGSSTVFEPAAGGSLAPPPLAGPTAEAGWTLAETADIASPSDWHWGDYSGQSSSNPENNFLSSNLSVSDGILDIHTQGQEGGGLCLCWGQPVSLYGRWQVQARFVGSSDHGFAILLWPNSEVWPQDGEIDISEISAPGKGETSSVVYGQPDNVQSIWIQNPDVDVNEWHTYTVDWEPGEILIYIDGNLSQTVTSHVPDLPMHLALQAQPDVPVASSASGDLYVSSVQVFYPS